MNVRQVIEALIGLDPRAEVEIVDSNGHAASLTQISTATYNGQLSICARIDGQIEDRQ